MLRKSLFLGMAAVLIAASFGFMGCADDPPKSGAKSIVAFSINDVDGSIDEETKRVAVTLPAGNDVTALEPVVVVSKAAQIIDPATGAAIGEAGTAANEKVLPANDFTVGKNYVVKAEDGSTQTYRVEVTVLPEVVLQSLVVDVSKKVYDYNEAFDIGSLVVTGVYSDDSESVETVVAANISGYDSTVEGTQNIKVTIDGVFAIFQVTVLPEVVLQSLVVDVSKWVYDYNEAFDIGSLVVTGVYSDGSESVETVAAANISGYDPTVEGTQNIKVTIDGVFAIFQVTVLPEEPEQSIAATIALPNSAEGPVVYGLPEGGLTLSRHGLTADTPSVALISVDGSDVWTDIQWFIDGADYSDDNIIRINASNNYTLTKPHTITFIGTKDGVEYSKTIVFTVVK